MKIRLLGTLVGLAIGFTVPAFAQEKDTVDPEVRQQIEAAQKKVDEAYNKHDAAALAALFTQDAVQVWLGWTGGAEASEPERALGGAGDSEQVRSVIERRAAHAKPAALAAAH